MNNVLPPILPRTRGATIPASLNQNRLYRIEQSSPNARGNLCYLIKIQGDCSTAILQQAFHEVISRHEILRTQFELNERAVMQTVCSAATVSWKSTDISICAEKAWMVSQGHEFASPPIDSSTAPLIKAAEFIHNPQKRTMMIAFHHLIFDGGSISLFTQELAAAYSQIRRFGSDKRPLPSLQFADFTLWQYDLLDSPLGLSAKSFWQGHVASSPLQKIYTQERRQRAYSDCRAISVSFDSELSDQIPLFAEKYGVRPLWIYLAAQVLSALKRGKPDDSFITMPVFNRRAPGSRNIIGWLANNLPIALPVKGLSTLLSIVIKIGELFQDINRYNFLPMSSVLKSVGADDNLSRQGAPIIFNYIPFTQATSSNGDTAFEFDVVTEMEPVVGTFYDQIIAVFENDFGTKLHIGYYLDAITSSEAEISAATYMRSLSEIILSPNDAVKHHLK